MDDLRQYLRTRWPARTRVLAGYALVSSLLFGALDVLFGRWLPPVSLHAALVVRGPFILIPVVGWMVQRIAPRSRALPAATIVLSIAWTWGNDWAFFALGSSNSAVHLAWLVGCYITVATCMPVMTPGRIGVFVAMMGGHLALDLASPQARPIGLRICSDGVLFALVVVEVTVVEKLRVSRWRGWQLQRELEESARRAEQSRRRGPRRSARRS